MKHRETIALTLAATTLCITASLAQEFAPGAFEVPWSSIDGGGGTSSGGAFEVTGTIGQPDAGVVLAGGAFEVTGGFWAGGSQPVETCPADISPLGPPMGDGLVNVADLLAVIAGWGQTGDPPADINGDHIVNVGDLLAVIGAWGVCD